MNEDKNILYDGLPNSNITNTPSILHTNVFVLIQVEHNMIAHVLFYFN